MHNDPYANSINKLHSAIEAQLKTKIEGNNACMGPFNRVSIGLGSISKLYENQVNPSLFEDINDQILSQQLIQLEMDLLISDPQSSTYTEVESQIRSLENRIYANEVNKLFNRNSFKDNRDSRLLALTYNHLNEVVNTLSTMPAECVDQLGGWQQVLPTILNTMSLSIRPQWIFLYSGSRFRTQTGILSGHPLTRHRCKKCNERYHPPQEQ